MLGLMTSGLRGEGLNPSEQAAIVSPRAVAVWLHPDPCVHVCFIVSLLLSVRTIGPYDEFGT
jgi:hypothetical protein